MAMATLTIELPQELESTLRAAGYTPERLSEETRRSLAIALFARKVLSLEQAARLSDMSQWEFIPFLGEHGIPVADYDQEEVKRETETAQWLSRNQVK